MCACVYNTIHSVISRYLKEKQAEMPNLAYIVVWYHRTTVQASGHNYKCQWETDIGTSN